VKHLGFVAVMMRPNPVAGRPWHHPDYDPLWSTLEDLDVPVCFHEGGAVGLPQVAIDRFAQHPFWHACTHPMEQQMAMLSLVMGGVAERHPRLRMAFMECGAGWLPYWMWRMDEAVEGEPWDFEALTLKPSEYVRRQCYVSIDSDEAPGVAAFEMFDEPHVVWGSDYPHQDSKFPYATRSLAALPGMTAGRLRQVVTDAPLSLFGVALRPLVAAKIGG
jgi:predicted TIM-barrel fold metal-dependent hydrolase